ncbi:MAG: tRNA (cytidine(34)-2'-O)-methyltransferase, partial [Candidatus Eremiobacteraeota bacterium]|nr:tRNA (cytidine(34)-2'-O)-methyltransferase [Candidatus Eremiobacteraeota bacterium]
MQPRERITSLESLAGVPLHIALVEPEIPPNTGNVARLCAATGCALHLVEPLGFRIDDRELKRAGLDYWESVDVVVHASLDAFLEETRHLGRWFFSTRAQRIFTVAEFAPGDILVFGKETAGLPATLLDRYPERALRIPMREGTVRSVNLSTAVGIAAYAALEKLEFPGM